MIDPPLRPPFGALLTLLWEHSHITDEPALLPILAREWGLAESVGLRACEDFKNRGWIKTFNLPGAAQLSAAGHAAAAAFDATVDRPISGSYLPQLPERLQAPLHTLWRQCIERRGNVDAPGFLDDHRDWSAALQELADTRLIAHELNDLRMTPLGLFSLGETEARGLLLLGRQIRAVLRAHYRDEGRRPHPITYAVLATQLGIDLAQLNWALTHLTDALRIWSDNYVPTFVEPNGYVHPRDAVLSESVFDVARALATFAANGAGRARLNPSSPATPALSLTSAPMPTTSTDTLDSVPPKVMICYSWDDTAHQAWVRQLAERLTHAGMRVILDQWHLRPGDEMTRFMEESIAEADYVVVVCTEKYASRVDARAGGAGYESTQLAAQLLTATQAAKKGSSRIIPVMRQSVWPRQVPRFLSGRLYIDLSEGIADAEGSFEDLVRTLHGTPKLVPPALGRNPFIGPQRVEVPSSGGSHDRGPTSATPPSTSQPSAETLRAVRTTRREASTALVARHASFAQIAPVTAGARMDLLEQLMRTHERYLTLLVANTLHEGLTVSHLAHEIEDVIVPQGWPQSGYTHYVNLPRALGWVVHRLAGASLLHQGRASEAVDLARKTLAWGEETRSILQTPELTGWPVVTNNSREAWEATRTWAEKFSGVAALFGDAQDLWVAFNAHFMTLNLAEFLERVVGGPSFSQIRKDRRHAPGVPLYFWGENLDVRRRAYRLVTDDHIALRQRVDTTRPHDFRALWPQWLDFQRSWLAIEQDRGSENRAPHEGLLDVLLKGP